MNTRCITVTITGVLDTNKVPCIIVKITRAWMSTCYHSSELCLMPCDTSSPMAHTNWCIYRQVVAKAMVVSTISCKLCQGLDGKALHFLPVLNGVLKPVLWFINIYFQLLQSHWVSYHTVKTLWQSNAVHLPSFSLAWTMWSPSFYHTSMCELSCQIYL